jgi:signal transduction histidine kinase/CheY-like chemotaxis protein
MALFFCLLVFGLQSFATYPTPDNATVDSLISDFDSAVYLNEDFQECKIAAEGLVALGTSLGNEKLRTRGLIRLSYAELLFGKKSGSLSERFAECEKFLGNETSIANAEFLLYSGYVNGKWLKNLDSGIEDLEESIWMLTQLESDDRLALACALCSELYQLKNNRSQMCNFGYLAIFIAEKIDSSAIKAAALSTGITAMQTSNDFDIVVRLSKELLEIDHESDIAWHGLYVAGKSDKWENKALRKIAELEEDDSADPFRAGQIASSYNKLSTAAFQRDRIDEGLKYADSAVHFAELAEDKTILSTATECSIYGAILNAETEESLNRILSGNEHLEDHCSLSISTAFKDAYQRVGSMEKSLHWSHRETERVLELRAIEHANRSKSANNYWTNELKSREQRSNTESEWRQALSFFWALVTLGSVAVTALIFSLLLRRERSRVEKQIEARTTALTTELQIATAADRAKSDFLSQINHEIRNPLAAILGYCSLLRQKAGETEEFVNGIFSSSQHLRELVDDVLEVSKIENSNLEIENLPFDLGLTVHEVGQIMSEKTVGKRIEFECNLGSVNNCRIVSDEAKIRQLALCLIANAIKFTDLGKVSVVFEVEHTGPDQQAALQVSVVDTGIGIPDADLERVFDRYYKCSNNSTVSGSGLGLYVSKKIVETMQGKIELTSKINVGTSVEVKIPVQLSENRPAGSNGSFSHQVTRPKMLVIDDQEAVRQTLVMQLENAGYESKGLLSVEKALASVKLWKPDFVLLDIHMPGRSGFDILLQIRELSAPRPIFVVAITGDASDVVKQECKAAGFDAFLTKPFQLDAVARLVVRAGLQLPAQANGDQQAAILNPKSPHGSEQQNIGSGTIKKRI